MGARKGTFRTLALIAGLGLAGCNERPHMAYDRPARLEQLAAGLPAAENAFRLLTDEPTVGRFACTLAIARFVVQDEGGLALVAMTPTEQAYWTEQMRGVAKLQDVVFLRPRSTRPEGDSTAVLCDTARRFGAPLLLIYAADALGPNSAQVLGVLYESATQRALATLHASSRMVDEEGQEESPDKKRGDHRGEDARCQAQRQFEAHTLACLRELMHHDSRPATTQPHKWDQPFIERWWIEYR